MELTSEGKHTLASGRPNWKGQRQTDIQTDRLSPILRPMLCYFLLQLCTSNRAKKFVSAHVRAKKNPFTPC